LTGQGFGLVLIRGLVRGRGGANI